MTATPTRTGPSPVLNDAAFLSAKFDDALTWDEYLATGKELQREAWLETYGRVALTDRQAEVIGGTQRDIKLLFLAGIWCGDCVRQGPMLQRVAEASGGRIDIRYADRDLHADLQSLVTVNGGKRVPAAIFCAEDFELVSVYGDKPLARYRIVAAQQLGANCPLPGAAIPDDDLAAELADWVDEVERVALILRLSARLREKHSD